MIYFDEPTHVYRLNDPENGKQLISVTTLIGKYKPHFDELFWSHYTAMRWSLGMEKKEFSSYLSRFFKFKFQEDDKSLQRLQDICNDLAIQWDIVIDLKDNVLAEWNRITVNSLQRGNVVHLYKEGKHYEDNFVFNEQKVDVYESNGNLYQYITELIKDKPVIIPELRIANERYGVAGSIDQPIFNIDGTFDVNDWKTYKEVKTDSKYYMLDPVKHIPDCNYYHCALQVSTYAWMIEQATGYTANDLYFTHFKFDEKDNIIGEKIFTVPYLKKEVKMILEHYESNKNNT